MTLGQRIRAGAKWSGAGSLTGQMLQFLVSIALARLLVPADFGLIATVQIFTGFAGIFASGGTGEALVRAQHVTRRDFNVVLTLQLTIGAFIFLLLYLGAPALAHWFANPLYQDLLRISAVSFLLRPFNNLPKVMLRREMRFKAISLID